MARKARPRGRSAARSAFRRLSALACLGGGLASSVNASAFQTTDEAMRTAPLVVASNVDAAPQTDPVLLAVGGGHQDQTPLARPTPVMNPIQGPLTLEGKYLGDVSGAVDAQGQGMIDAVGLMDLLGPQLSPALRETLASRIAAQAKVNMADLKSDDFSLFFDPLALTFVAALSPEGRVRRKVSFYQNEVVDPKAFDQPAGFSTGANITLAQLYSHTEDRLSPLQGGIDLFANLGGFDGVTLTTGVDYDGGSPQRWRRREIRLSKDLFQSAVRVTAGEFAPPIENFQGSRRFLGISAARAYSTIRPFQNVRPAGRRQFILDRPALVVVEVNGIVTERIRLDAGPYSLGDFPFGQGANTVRLLVEDDRGQREIAVFDLFGGTGLLDPGVLDFGASVGVLEQGGQLKYGSTLAATGFMRKGLSDVLTVGANAQVADGRGQVGGLATWGSKAGLIQFSGAASRNDATGKNGYIASVDYLREAVFSKKVDARLVASAQATSRFFQNAFDTSTDNRERWRAATRVLVRSGQYSLNAGVAFVKGRGRPDRTDYNVGLGRSFKRFAVNLAWQRGSTSDGRDEDRFGLTLTSRFGGRWSTTARYDSQNRFREVGVSRASSNRLNDISGDFRVSEDRNNQALTADVRYINNRFDAELVSNRLVATAPGGVSRQESLWRVSTMIGYAGGAFGMGRTAREGFILATPHPTLAKSRVSLTDASGQAVAHSGWLGPALAGIDRGYGVRRYEIQADPLPPGYDLGSGIVTAFPGFGNGYRVVVGSDASRTARGVLMSPSGPAALVGGVLEPVGAKPGAAGQPFFTNRNGRFVADGLAPGRYRLLIRGEAVGEILIPANVEGTIDVGEIRISRPTP
jgi:outer membrane usher protein FimD/PapC